ncbi:hypothetical protein ABC345_20690 [Shouchella sp. 1P09AA]|uniref:hypothetical protein n=1 Tax=unclassified Shouchella TaxID=2893065 RepID=UPI0039A0A76D
MRRKIRIDSSFKFDLIKATFNSEYLEDGGLIYGRFNEDTIKLFKLSDAGPKSIRKKFSIEFDNVFIKEFTNKMLLEGFYLFGTWHTHPENSSLNLSNLDVKTICSFGGQYPDCFKPLFIITNISNGSFNYRIYEYKSDNINLVNDKYIVWEE